MSATGNRYCDFKIQQTKEEIKRVVCFSPEKREAIKLNENNKSPVKLLHVSQKERKYEPDSIECTMGNKCKVMKANNIPFPWHQLGGAEQVLPVKHVNKKNTNRDVVSVTANVVSKGITDSVYSHTIWREMIAKVMEGYTYAFNKMPVSYFNDKFLTGTQEPAIKEIKAIEFSRKYFQKPTN